MVLVLLTIMLGAVEWSLTLASDRLNPQPKADIQTGTGNPPQVPSQTCFHLWLLQIPWQFVPQLQGLFLSD
jgi:hypothetical protein